MKTHTPIPDIPDYYDSPFRKPKLYFEGNFILEKPSGIFSVVILQDKNFVGNKISEKRKPIKVGKYRPYRINWVSDFYKIFEKFVPLCAPKQH